MRHPLPVLLVSLAACAPEDGAESPLSWRSTLTAGTAGLVLHGDGRTGHAGMFDTNCPFETEHGDVTGDYDLPGQGEEVQDGGTSPMGPETVVLVRDATVHLLEKSTGEYAIDQVAWPGIRQARLYDEGLVGATDGCRVEWRVAGSVVRHEAAAEEVCGGSMDAGRDGTVVLGAAEALHVLTPDGDLRIATGAELLAFDDELSQAYAANEGDAEVRAFSLGGEVAWATPVDGVVRALSEAGEQGAAVVSWERPDGTGVLTWLSGTDGAPLASVDTPSSADAVHVSRDGSVVALVRPDATYFYAVGDLR